MKSIIKSNVFSLGLLFTISCILISVTNHFILTVNFFNNSGEYLSGDPEREVDIYEQLQKYIYLSTLIYTTFKILLVALILNTALYLSDINLGFSKTLRITILSEFIFLLQAAAKIIWFKFEYPAGTLLDWHKVYVFSMLSVFENISADWYYPLQTLNLFEVAYWFVLAYGIKRSTSLTYDRSLQMVVFSYLPLLIVWVAAATFCTVLLFPTTA